ncbi:MerR family transcriptional regulator [Catenulispora subtropica]|uniref:MerR family transcriptional regulator n=1 Tax=Catenulispora subtropica TaxID=450798 RepID=A0ABN2TCZ6_9ACTN
MRPVDLARAAGVSTQQVRNLESLGALPEAERSASGYRRYDERHLAALLAYQALTAGMGPTGARALLTAVGAGSVADALAMLDAAHAGLHQGRASLVETEQSLAAVNQEPVNLAPDGLRVGALAKLLGVRPSALRVWEAAGLLAPSREPSTGYRVYRAQDVRDAQVIHTLRQSHYLFDRIRPIVEGLRRTGGSEELRTALAERREMLDRRAFALLEGSALLWRYLGRLSQIDQSAAEL